MIILRFWPVFNEEIYSVRDRGWNRHEPAGPHPQHYPRGGRGYHGLSLHLYQPQVGQAQAQAPGHGYRYQVSGYKSILLNKIPLSRNSKGFTIV